MVHYALWCIALALIQPRSRVGWVRYDGGRVRWVGCGKGGREGGWEAGREWGEPGDRGW